MGYYVGKVVHGGHGYKDIETKREVFSSKKKPTESSHGHKYTYVIGPFKSKAAAEWLVSHPESTLRSVSEIEKYVKAQAVVRLAYIRAERTRRSVLGGTPDTFNMKYGGTRYKYNNGISIDYVEKDGLFYAWQAGNPTVKLGHATTLQEAEEIAVQGADLSTAWVHDQAVGR
jgi:hypothetical protein